MEYEIDKKFLGKSIVAFDCEGCGEPLEAPLEDAGSEQTCPKCGRPFITPGVKEWEDKRQEERQKIAEKEQQHNMELTERRRKELEALETKRESQREREILASAPPELVWYGKMTCEACGYQWQARRNTPPARCPACSKRTAVPVREQKRTGCLAMILIVTFSSTAVFLGVHAWHA